MKATSLLALVACGSCAFGVEAGPPVRLGGFDTARGGDCALTTGFWFAPLRDAIAGGFPGSALTGAPELTNDYLDGIDVLLVSAVEYASCDSIAPLTAMEQDALRAFVERGGTALVFCDGVACVGPEASQSLLMAFGLTIGGTNDDGAATFSPPLVDPLSNGRFGSASAIDTFNGGWLDQMGSATPLAILPSGHVELAYIPPCAFAAGSGPVAAFSDTSMIFDGYMTPRNLTVVLNAIALSELPRNRFTADMNSDQILSVQDIFDFLALWFSGDIVGGNFNGDCCLTAQDIFDFLAAWFGMTTLC